MTVELWYGEKPTNPGEQNVLVELYDFLKSKQEHYVLMCNFRTSRGNEIDLMLIKRNAIFLVEVKHFWNKVVGDREGKWRCIEPDGNEFEFGNPYKQIMSRDYNWQAWCERNQAEIVKVTEQERDLIQYRPDKYIVFYPDIPAESEIDIGDHPVQAIGLEKFRTSLPIRTVTGLNFTKKELQAIPRLLKLTQWHIDPPPSGRDTIKLDGDIQPPVVRMLVPRNPDPILRVFHIERGLVTMGRDSGCDLVVNHDSISRKHAEISRVDNYWAVKDLKSLNGTFVSFNGDPEMERRVDGVNALRNGSIVRFGEISYTVILDE